MSRPSIRIVTPSFQQGAFVEQTIRSVLRQQYDRLTYFVADGGSTDETVAICRRHLRPDQWRSGRDGGQVDALIQSFAVGEEEVLGWVNSDDCLLPDALERVAAQFAADPDLAIVHGDGVLIDHAGRSRVFCPSMPIDRSVLTENNVLVQPSTFFRRSWYERVGGFDRRLSKAFDFDLFLKIVIAGGRCRYVPAAMSAFRIHETGQTTALWRDFIPEVLAIQWRHGDRRQFARRFAAKVCILARGPVSPWRRAFDDAEKRLPVAASNFDEAHAFLGERLDAVLGTGDWRRDAPPQKVATFVRGEAALLDVLFGRESGSRWSAALKLMTPGNASAVGAWARNVLATGQLGALWKIWRLTHRRGNPLPDARDAASQIERTTTAAA